MIGATAGAIAGMCLVGSLHWLFPAASDVAWLDVAIVGGAAVFGLWLDVRNTPEK